MQFDRPASRKLRVLCDSIGGMWRPAGITHEKRLRVPAPVRPIDLTLPRVCQRRVESKWKIVGTSPSTSFVLPRQGTRSLQSIFSRNDWHPVCSTMPAYRRHLFLQVATLLKHNVVCTTLIDVKTPPCLSGIVVFYIVFRSRHLSNWLRLLTINVDSK